MAFEWSVLSIVAYGLLPLLFLPFMRDARSSFKKMTIISWSKIKLGRLYEIIIN